MAISDCAFAVNGEMVNECGAFQLPTIVVNQVGLFQAYMTLLYNQFSKFLTINKWKFNRFMTFIFRFWFEINFLDSDLNFTANGMVNPELMACRFGDAFPEKVAEHLQELQSQPKMRYLKAK